YEIAKALRQVDPGGLTRPLHDLEVDVVPELHRADIGLESADVRRAHLGQSATVLRQHLELRVDERHVAAGSLRELANGRRRRAARDEDGDGEARGASGRGPHRFTPMPI